MTKSLGDVVHFFK